MFEVYHNLLYKTNPNQIHFRKGGLRFWVSPFDTAFGLLRTR